MKKLRGAVVQGYLFPKIDAAVFIILFVFYFVGGGKVKPHFCSILK
jgi:hypothetical protein